MADKAPSPFCPYLKELGRLFPAIPAQHQQPDGSVTVPEPLRAWLGTDRIGG